MTELEQSGCPIDTARRRELLHTVLNVNGVSESEGELYVVTDAPGFQTALGGGLVAAMLRASEIRNIVYADWVQTRCGHVGWGDDPW
ncbi:MAG: DUF1828 domain-containing protein [Candidatus Methanomethylophilaceae archaeon]|nr:DUF1828 domain-containing protein [Candidatus Methanomethylophilaceae archaeon]